MNKYNLYIDIETIPSENDELKQEIAAGIKPPANYKKPESIEKWEKENKPALIEKALKEMSFDAGTAEIVAISCAQGDNPIYSLYRDQECSELLLLQRLNTYFSELKKDIHTENNVIWTGHYITGFDLRFLWKRYIINRTRPAIKIPYDAKPWSNNIYDTCHEWGGGKDRSSLDFVCKALGIKGKEGMNGSQVYDYWKAGRYVDIADYCNDDVQRVREIHKAMTFNG